MASIRSRSKMMLGIFVDGLDVKLAHLTMKKNRIVVNELKSGTLVSKMHDAKAVDMATVGVDTADAFSLPVSQGPETTQESQSEDNNAVLLGLLSQYPAKKYSISYSVAEPAIYYHLLESDFGLKGKKLKDRILEELRNVRAFQPSSDAVDSIKTDEGNLLCIVR